MHNAKPERPGSNHAPNHFGMERLSIWLLRLMRDTGTNHIVAVYQRPDVDGKIGVLDRLLACRQASLNGRDWVVADRQQRDRQARSCPEGRGQVARTVQHANDMDFVACADEEDQIAAVPGDPQPGDQVVTRRKTARPLDGLRRDSAQFLDEGRRPRWIVRRDIQRDRLEVGDRRGQIDQAPHPCPARRSAISA